ncbi:VPLPA-CTERM sorting domain-containing protein [Yoonia sp.]|uniref:VPLPA-CTERM sorting domain-containing protein n=1 Tax=Yoonia sp. TaxID=2212373 RepID=UPI003976C6E0
MISKMKTIGATAAFATAMMLSAQAAGATTIEINCNTLNFTESTSCIAPVSGGPGGNVTGSVMDEYSNTDIFTTEGAFGYTGWDELDGFNIDQDQSLPSTQTGRLFSFTFTVTDGYRSGTWTLNDGYTWGDGVYAFALKGSNDNAVYLMDTDYTSGTWSMSDIVTGNDNNPDLSNITLLGTDDLSPIPLPAAGWLLLMGLGGLGIASRRKSKAQTA